ncbi:MAG: hypothetical protein ACD_73C00794G0001 [uncultured bacterium]|nr:MAG: hypothetical protein ACD_73C00794G0001 [uncultured bacterium]
MQLRNNNTFRAINDKSSGTCHQGDGAKIDFLLFDITNGLRPGFRIIIPNNKPDSQLDGRFVRHASLTTFIYIVFWLFKLIRNVLKRSCVIKITYRKHAFKYAM